MKLRIYIIGACIAAILQVYFAGGFIFERATLLRTGQEVTLNTGFVDPRDLFRGHYVRLRLTIGSVHKSLFEEVPVSPYWKQPFYAELAQSEDGFWAPIKLHTEIPKDTNAPILKGFYSASWGHNIILSFPIDRYFAPKLEAIKLENLRRDRKLGIIVALDKEGNAGIKGITVDGEKVYDEPLF